jgi:hypothetical protein
MLYFFLLLIPTTTPVCVLWIDHAPIGNDYIPPVCPISQMVQWEYYNLRLISGNGLVLCEWNAGDGGIITIPCTPQPANNYHIEVWLKYNVSTHCNIWNESNRITRGDISTQCPEWLAAYDRGILEIRGPYPITPAINVNNGCTLPPVNNNVSLVTNFDYQYLADRLNWWGISTTVQEWQNQYNESIRGAAVAAGIPAKLFKGMLANESQFWVLWTGSTGEYGWLQVTWEGADNALRYDRELYNKYCPMGIWYRYCVGYDLMSNDQQNKTINALLRDLTLTGTPREATDQAAGDLWIYAHVIRSFACQAQILYPALELWSTAAVLYNAGNECIKDGVICERGIDYLDRLTNNGY